MSGVKACRDCGVEKPATEFYKERWGHRRECKAYTRRQTREWRQGRRARERGYEVMPDDPTRCLYADCYRKGEYLPEGYGFRFCEDHAPAAREVLDGKSLEPTPEPAPKPEGPPGRVVVTKACGHAIEPWNRIIERSGPTEYWRCKACKRARNVKRKQPHIDKQKVADAKFAQLKKENA